MARRLSHASGDYFCPVCSKQLHQSFTVSAATTTTSAATTTTTTLKDINSFYVCPQAQSAANKSRKVKKLMWEVDFDSRDQTLRCLLGSCFGILELKLWRRSGSIHRWASDRWLKRRRRAAPLTSSRSVATNSACGQQQGCSYVRCATAISRLLLQCQIPASIKKKIKENKTKNYPGSPKKCKTEN